MKKKFWLVFGNFLLCGLAVAIILLSFVKCSPLKNASKNLTSYVIDAELDESLAEYSSCLFFEDNNVGDTYKNLIKDATASYLLYVDVIGSLNKNINLEMNLSVDKYASEYEYTYMVYVKGVIMLDSLRDVVGKDKLIKALKNYCKNYSFKLAKPENFIEIVKKTCHKDVDGFFSGWLAGTNVVATTFVSIL